MDWRKVVGWMFRVRVEMVVAVMLPKWHFQEGIGRWIHQGVQRVYELPR